MEKYTPKAETSELPEARDLTETEQADLRETLDRVMGRRSFVAKGVAAIAMASGAVPKEAMANVESSPRPKERPNYFESFDQSAYERLPKHSKKMLTAILTKEQHLLMPEGALVKDKQGRVLGFVKTQILGDEHPGAGFDETGHVSDGYAKRWKQKVKSEAVKSETVKKLGLSEDDIEVDYGNWVDIKSLSNKLGAYPENIFDGVVYFGFEEVPGTGLTKMEYLRENFYVQNDDMPEELVDNLRYMCLGIPGEETRFVETSVSSAGAKTTFQFLESTWEGMGYPPFSEYPGGMPPYEIQVEAFGKYIGQLYRELHTGKTTEQLSQIAKLFSSEQDYYQYFLTPLIINAYNAGAGTMRAAVDHFIQSAVYKELELSPAEKGYDVFYMMSQLAYKSNDGALANYQDWAGAYPTSVMAYAKASNTVVDKPVA